ncbi:hypothetical protein CYY_002610 [Polysphondylium violaceum]|uniref:Guanine nucleotide-binding protein-like 1 n=1 Tax=Polysphondylium violaceum TaxID=133409 RepID=A0A8J4UUZ9_9MYCE|nr:hypothetical protein CYY_002610 [Polysphondylium violaceum]
MARSKPFSGKQKKDQLKAKKERKRIEATLLDENIDISLGEKRKLAKQILSEKNKEKLQNKKKINNDDDNDDDDIDDKNDDEIIESENNSDNESNGEYSDTDSVDDNKNSNSKTTAPTTGSSSTLSQINQRMKDFDLSSKDSKINRLVTIFDRESREEIEYRKEQSKLPLNTSLRDKPWLIMKQFDYQDQQFYDANNIEQQREQLYIDIPKRPEWNFQMSAQKLKEQERKSFAAWLENIYNKYDKSRLNYFEHNLEVWRQLWRVCEKSDVILLVTDARYPLFHFPPALYHYIHSELKKPMILVLNKVDLVNSKIISAWINYFSIHFPLLKIITFSSFKSNLDDDTTDGTSVAIDKKRKFRKGRKRYDLSLGKQHLINTVLSLNIEKDNSSNSSNNNNQYYQEQDQIDDDSDNSDDSDDDSSNDDDEYQQHQDDDDSDQDDDNIYRKENPLKDMITVGMVGHPNVGKSSLINGLMGKKVVSTSRTPGHTKHFQTIFLTKDIQLCDCPGLVFPALDRPKSLQILCGLFPIAQVREPYSAIQFLCERTPLEVIYALKNPYPDEPWSAYSICEAFALKRGYLIAKSGRPDPHRAGLEILKECVDGNIVISWPPPDFTIEDFQEIGIYQQSQKHQLYNNTKNNDGDSSDGDNDQDIYSDSDEFFMNHSNGSNSNNSNNNNNNNNNHHNQRKPKKTGKSKTNTKETTSTTSTTSGGGKKKLSSKALEYQERLMEKQNKGGNRRQEL